MWENLEDQVKECLKFSLEKGLGKFLESEVITYNAIHNLVTSRKLRSFSPRLNDFRLVLVGS